MKEKLVSNATVEYSKILRGIYTTETYFPMNSILRKLAFKSRVTNVFFLYHYILKPLTNLKNYSNL